jgi:hypothetical protein
MKPCQRRLTLVKGREQFVFRYAEGREADLLAALVALARDSESSFDWFDAAAMSLQMGRRLEPELDRVV